MKFSFAYELTRKDYGNFCLYNYWNKRKQGAIISLLGVLFLINFVVSDLLKFQIWEHILYSVVFSAFFLFSIRNQLKNAGKVFKENGPMLCYKTYEFSDEAIIGSDWYTSSKISWHAIGSISDSKNGAYLYLDGTMALILPAHAFPTPQIKADFIAAVKQKIATTRASAPGR